MLEESFNYVAVFRYMRRNKLVLASSCIIVAYVVVALLTCLGLVASDWNYGVQGDEYLSPGVKYFFGTDFLGRSVSKKILKGAQVAMTVGFVVAIIAVFLGVTLGCLAGYFGGAVDAAVVWGCNVCDSIPSIMLQVAIAFLFDRKSLAVYLGLPLTSWMSLCRLIRAEVMRHKAQEYIQAATAIGAGHFRKLFIHILPNVQHIAIIQFSLIFQLAIKKEVVLSYLGIGVQGVPSWGLMIGEARTELLRGCWWQLFFATFAMFFVILALNILSDAVRDATDPKLQRR